MQPIKILSQWLLEYGNKNHYLFSLADLKVLFPSLSYGAQKTLMSRAVSSGLLMRACRGLYLYKPAIPRDGLLLFHIAARLRRANFNYISFETILSEYGVISQIPFNWISVMSSGRSQIISCGSLGTIEFIHTEQKPNELIGQVFYDRERGLWRAKVPLAIRDMKRTRRNCDLIDWEVANEYL